jgi:hypothetical protein
MKQLIRFLVVALALTTLVGCSANKPFRKSLPDPRGVGSILDCTNCYTIETNADYKLGVVEFDDQGWFWAHKQWRAVKEAIETEATNSPGGLTLVVFVHGWKNNADSDNGNVKMFRSVLASLSQTTAPRKLFGVYVGWRGLSATSDYLPPLAKELSFFNRKAVAERIGHQGAATQVFTELQVMQEEFNHQWPERPATELILIGHSFGGQLLYSSVCQVLTERLVIASRHKGKAPVKSFGNLVILLNPAFEASLYNNLIALATSSDIAYPTNSQRPVLAIFTSKTDWATKRIFPAGRFFSTWFENTRRPDDTNLFNITKQPTADQRQAILQTIGHDQEFLTYDLNYTNYGTTLPVAEKTFATETAQRETFIQNIESLRSQWMTDSFVTNTGYARPISYVFSNSIGDTRYACILEPRTNGRFAHKPGNPFLNVAVDKQIMDGHNDITNPVMVKFLRDFILFTQTNNINPRHIH